VARAKGKWESLELAEMMAAIAHDSPVKKPAHMCSLARTPCASLSRRPPQPWPARHRTLATITALS
jgi:hypothetical protein